MSSKRRSTRSSTLYNTDKECVICGGKVTVSSNKYVAAHASCTAKTIAKAGFSLAGIILASRKSKQE